MSGFTLACVLGLIVAIFGLALVKGGFERYGGWNLFYLVQGVGIFILFKDEILVRLSLSHAAQSKDLEQSALAYLFFAFGIYLLVRLFIVLFSKRID